MKLKDFLTLKVGSGILVSGTRYSPYTNYSWSQTLTVGGNQQIKDIGTAGLNLQQFFGQGAWFNGIDQNIQVESITPSVTSARWTLCFHVNTATNSKYIVRAVGGTNKIFWFNGGLTYHNGSTNIKLDTTNRAGFYVIKSDGTNIYTYLNSILISTISQPTEQLSLRTIKDIGGLSGNSSSFFLGVIKDVYLFHRDISLEEIDKYNNQPNQFFMDSLEDSSCVLAMPMCEKDGFVRNYKSYSEGSNLVGAYANTDYGTFGTQGTLTKDKDIYTQTVTVVGTSNTFPRCDFVNSGIRYANKAYVYEFDYEVLSGTCILTGFFHGGIFGAQVLTGKGRVCVVSIGTQARSSNNIYFDGRNLFSVKYWNFSVKELTAIYPISNYLSTCRTNAQRLPYGLQTSGFKRDTNGLILSKSNFLEADGVGYGNTRWIPKWNEDFTVESVFEVSNDSEFRLNGNNYADGIYFGKNSVGKSLYVRVFGAPVILLANSKDIVCLIFSYNWQTKEVKQYVDGVLVTTQLATKTTNSPLPVLLGMVALGGTNYPIMKPLRLFKTHSKVLTQEEVSKNFNKYQAQGLLNE